MIHSEESHNANTTTNTVLVTELRSMEWARNILGVGEIRNVHKIPVRGLQEMRPLWTF
jgi:hypothetical protein